jgi:predicted DNA-binding ribbon-helix-helix protein
VLNPWPVQKQGRPCSRTYPRSSFARASFRSGSIVTFAMSTCLCSEGSLALEVSCTNAAASIFPVLRTDSELYNSLRRSRQSAKLSNQVSSSLTAAASCSAIRGSRTAVMLTDFGAEYANSIAQRSDLRGRRSFRPLKRLTSNSANARNLASALTIGCALNPHSSAKTPMNSP